MQIWWPEYGGQAGATAPAGYPEERRRPVGKGKAPRLRHTGPSPAERWTERCRALAAALELLIEGWRLLRDLFGGWPW
jgi:hypothetical protein